VGSVIERDQILINGEWAPSAGIDVLEVINRSPRGQARSSRPGA